MIQSESKSNVFVVEDDLAVRQAICTLVESMGLNVVQFESAEDFLRDFNSDWSGCIIADFRLRGMSGVELLKKLADMGRRMPMVIVTGNATTQTVVCAMRHGAVTVLDRPFDTNELWQAIRDAIEQDKVNRQKETQIADLKAQFGQLTEQEMTVLRLIVSGYINKQISKQLDVSVRTIESRRQQIFKKTGARNLGELMWRAMMLRAEGYDWFTEPEELEQARSATEPSVEITQPST